MTRSINTPQFDVEVASLKRRVSDLERILRTVASRRAADIDQSEFAVGDFARGATQSITDGAGLQAIQLDQIEVRIGDEFMDFSGTNLRLSVAGFYLLEWSVNFPSLAVNGVFFTGADCVFGNSATGGAANPDYKFTTTSQTGRGVPRMTRIIAVDEGTVITFYAGQTSGANRNATLFGTIARLAPNPDAWRSL